MKRLTAALLCILLLSGCGKAAREPLATPSLPKALTPLPALVATPISALSPLRPLSELDYGRKQNDLTIGSWQEIKQLSAAHGEQAYTGLRIDNTREGNSVTINMIMEQTAEFTIGGMTLNTQDGKTSFLPIISSPDQTSAYACLQFADLDADGTEEIILFVDYHNSGGLGDLHVISCKQSELNEIYTVIGGYQGNALREVYADTLKRTEDCSGVFLYQTEQGIAMRVSLYAENHQARHYGDLAYRDGAWEQIKAFTLVTEEDAKAQFHRLEPAFAGDHDDLAYLQWAGRPIDIRGTGQTQDIVYMHYAYGNNPHAMYILFEAQIGLGANARHEVLWRAAYPDAGSFTYMFEDLDVDGVEELLFVVDRGEGEDSFLEMHLMKFTQSGFYEVLTYFNGGKQEEKRAYTETLFALPNAGALPYESAEALNHSVQWAQLVPLSEGNVIEFTHSNANGETAAYSRIGYAEGKWLLLEQGAKETQPENTDLDDLLKEQNVQETE